MALWCGLTYNSSHAGIGAYGQGEYVPRNVLYRVLVSGNDYMTTPLASERDNSSFVLDGAVFYVPLNSTLDTPTAPLYRLKYKYTSGLYSYRYAWAEWAKAAGYPERFAQIALDHNSKAVHRAYAKNALVKLSGRVY